MEENCFRKKNPPIRINKGSIKAFPNMSQTLSRISPSKSRALKPHIKKTTLIHPLVKMRASSHTNWATSSFIINKREIIQIPNNQPRQILISRKLCERSPESIPKVGIRTSIHRRTDLIWLVIWRN